MPTATGGTTTKTWRTGLNPNLRRNFAAQLDHAFMTIMMKNTGGNDSTGTQEYF